MFVGLLNWKRRDRDSNPGYLAVQRFSRPPQSTTLPPLQNSFQECFIFLKRCKGTHYFYICKYFATFFAFFFHCSTFVPEIDRLLY